MPETRQALLVAEAAGRLLVHGEQVPSHHHEDGQLVYPASGILAVATARGTWIAPCNRAVWIPAGFAHHHRAFGATDMRTLLLAAPLAKRLAEKPVVVAVSPLLREVILALGDERRYAPGARRRLQRVALDELTCAPEQPLHLPEPGDDRLRALTDLLHVDPGSSATLAELGRVIGASERTLSRLFHTELAMSFHQWRTQLRVHHALALLANGHSVTLTATECGWSNPSTFIEAFTATVGSTPGRYQSQQQLENDR